MTDNQQILKHVTEEIQKCLLGYVGDEPTEKTKDDIKSKLLALITNHLITTCPYDVSVKYDPLYPNRIIAYVTPKSNRISLTFTLTKDDIILHE